MWNNSDGLIISRKILKIPIWFTFLPIQLLQLFYTVQQMLNLSNFAEKVNIIGFIIKLFLQTIIWRHHTNFNTELRFTSCGVFKRLSILLIYFSTSAFLNAIVGINSMQLNFAYHLFFNIIKSKRRKHLTCSQMAYMSFRFHEVAWPCLTCLGLCAWALEKEGYKSRYATCTMIQRPQILSLGVNHGGASWVPPPLPTSLVKGTFI
jgi:hypothetical protein